LLSSSLLHHLLSELELGNNMSTIGELSKRLLSRRPNVEPILSQLFLQPGTNLVAKTYSLSIKQCDVKDGNSKAKENSSDDVSKSKNRREIENKEKGNKSRKKKGKRSSKK
jgi:hypothetical protein